MSGIEVSVESVTGYMIEGVGGCKLMSWCVRGEALSWEWWSCVLHVLNHQWVRVGGVYVLGKGEKGVRRGLGDCNGYRGPEAVGVHWSGRWRTTGRGLWNIVITRQTSVGVVGGVGGVGGWGGGGGGGVGGVGGGGGGGGGGGVGGRAV